MSREIIFDLSTWYIRYGNEWDTVTSIVSYNASYRFYWGQIAGLIKALPATATTLSNPQQNQLSQQDENKVNRG